MATKIWGITDDVLLDGPNTRPPVISGVGEIETAF
jgi:hypothetical protein